MDLNGENRHLLAPNYARDKACMAHPWRTKGVFVRKGALHWLEPILVDSSR